MGLNFILLIVGLIVCFGSIYIRKVCSALLGLIWGALFSFVVILMTVGLWGNIKNGDHKLDVTWYGGEPLL